MVVFEAGAGAVKSESVEEVSELLEATSTLALGRNVELNLDEVLRVNVRSATWLDMEDIILRHTRTDLVLIK